MLQFTDIQAAAARLKGVAHHTPILTSTTLNAMLGCEVFMKAENFQRMGAFKFRGGYNAINSLTDAERARGVLAFSSGNHAQAVALAARFHGCTATILMPADAPNAKLDATREYGAELITYDRYTEDRSALAKRYAEERNAVLIPPYDYLPVMAGQGTCGLEIAEEVANDEIGDHPDDVGYGIGFGESRDSAGTEATKACRKDGNKNCTVKVRFDGCGAYAASKRY